jgi:hypothetical protein
VSASFLLISLLLCLMLHLDDTLSSFTPILWATLVRRSISLRIVFELTCRVMLAFGTLMKSNFISVISLSAEDETTTVAVVVRLAVVDAVAGWCSC